MKIIHYSQQYEEKVIALWNQTLTQDSLNQDVFRKQIIFDENFNSDLFLLAFENDQLIAFLLGMKRKFPYLERGLESEKAWISVIGVHPDYRRKQIASILVNEIEEKFKQSNTTQIILASYSPNYFFPGIDKESYPNAIPFFTKLGYQLEGEAVSMHRSLLTYRFEETYRLRKENAEKQGYQFKPFTYDYSLKLLNFLQCEFGGGWKSNALGSLKQNEAEKTIMIVCDKQDDIVGFCMRKMDGCDHRFGPFGIAESLRSEGLGSILFELMMLQMKQQKLFHLYFLWTHGAGMRFYLRHGLEVYRTYVLGKKQLGD